MTARVLVVDDVLANVKLMEARLTAEYFDVVTAMSGAEALAMCERAQCDIVLLDVMMPEMDGFEVCRRLKTNPKTHHIPVIMVTALDQPSDRVRGLEAGADDFLTKPVSDVALIARVRSLVRLKMVTDELRMRAVTSKEIGIQDPAPTALAEAGRNGKVLLVDDRRSSYERIARALTSEHAVDVETNPHDALVPRRRRRLRPAHGLARSGQLRRLAAVQPGALARAHAQSADPHRRRGRGQRAAAARPGDRRQRLSGAADRQERDVRARAHADPQEALRRPAARQSPAVDGAGDHRCAHRPAQSPLHGKPPRHAGRARRRRAASRCRCCILDIDYFKSINDSFGHDAGDDVLREFAVRVRKSIRGIDLACRYGGEEFVVVMPETDMAVAALVAERIRRRIAGEPFPIQKGAAAVEVTISIGIAALGSAEDRRTPCSSGPTRRSTAPNATAATGWWPMRRSIAYGCARARVNHNALG